MAAEQDDQNPDIADEPHKLEIPTRRVKNIMKLDKGINKVNSDALFVVASATEIFLQLLTEKSASVAMEKKKRTIRMEHVRLAVKRHRPTADFLLDSLPKPLQPSEEKPPKDRAKPHSDKKPVPFATRSIEAFFQKFS